MEIQSIATLAKGWGMKREKTDDGEAVYARLRFTGLFLSVSQLDELQGLEPGAHRPLYDALGAPKLARSIEPMPDKLCITGTIGDGGKRDRLALVEADITSLALALVPDGAELSGELRWLVAGDEAADCEPLLGRVCSVYWRITNRQGDLLAAA